MKKLIAAAAALLLTAGIAGLTACSGSAEASAASTKSGSELTAAGIKLNLPENWTATVGDKVYEIVLDSAGSGSSSDVESFKKLCEDNGTAYLAYAVNSEETAVLTLTSLRITRRNHRRDTHRRGLRPPEPRYRSIQLPGKRNVHQELQLRR